VSRSSLVVLLADSRIRYGIYEGTSDTCFERLFEQYDDAWEAYIRGTISDFPATDSVEQDAEIYSDYGGGFWWPGRATSDRLIGPLDWDSFYESMLDGCPDWAKEALENRNFPGFSYSP
jgi:hypothetical protein